MDREIHLQTHVEHDGPQRLHRKPRTGGVTRGPGPRRRHMKRETIHSSSDDLADPSSPEVTCYTAGGCLTVLPQESAHLVCGCSKARRDPSRDRHALVTAVTVEAFIHPDLPTNHKDHP